MMQNILIITLTVIMGNSLAMADDNVKKDIIAFEQSIPWSDVYENFTMRQKSWQNEVMEASTPQELGMLLVELQAVMKKETLGKDWKMVKDECIAKTNTSSSFDDVKHSLGQLHSYYVRYLSQAGGNVIRETIAFEQYIPWEDVKEGFRVRQRTWRHEVMNAKTPVQLAALISELHGWIYPERFSNEWTVKKPSWVKKATNASTWQDVADILKELQWNYRKGK